MCACFCVILILCDRSSALTNTQACAAIPTGTLLTCTKAQLTCTSKSRRSFIDYLELCVQLTTSWSVHMSFKRGGKKREKKWKILYKYSGSDITEGFVYELCKFEVVLSGYFSTVCAALKSNTSNTVAPTCFKGETFVTNQRVVL